MVILLLFLCWIWNTPTFLMMFLMNRFSNIFNFFWTFITSDTFINSTSSNLGLPGGTALLGALSTQPGRPSTFFLIFFRRLRSQKSRISRVSLPLALFHVYTFTDGHRCMFLFQISSTNTFLCHGRCMLGPTLDIRPSYYF